MKIDELIKYQDLEYQKFNQKIVQSKKPMIGVRTPIIKLAAKQNNYIDNLDFINDLPHKYYEEDQLHSFMIMNIKDYDICIKEVDKFIYYIDNWAVCDSLIPKIFKKNKDDLIHYIDKWINSKQEFVIRFGIKMLMNYYLDDDFKIDYLNKVINIKENDYYVMMMKAWYLAEGLIKKYDDFIKVIESKNLDVRVHNKAIQKAIESYRITEAKKDYLRELKIK